MIMHKRKIRDIIVLGTVITIAALLFMGFPKEVVVNLLMTSLLIGSIVYVLSYSLSDTLKNIRGINEAKRLKALKLSTDEIDTMPGKEFEVYVARWLKDQGYEDVTLTEYYDHGADIIAKKDGIKWGIQVKRYSNIVRLEPIRQAVLALKHYQCDQAMVITNSFYSSRAKELANQHNCVLIDGQYLRSHSKTI